MPDRALFDPLREFLLEAAAHLTAEVRSGAEVPFDLIEQRGSGPALYDYRPRALEFVSGRWSELRELPGFELATAALTPRVRAYARVRAIPAVTPEDVLLDLTEQLYDGASDFRFPEPRFNRLCEDLESNVGDGTLTVEIVARLRGVTLEAPRVSLDDELSLVMGRAAGDLPEDLMLGDDCRLPPEVVCSFRVQQDADEPAPLDEARARFRRLITGLRLIGAPGATIDSLAWVRAGSGAWTPVAIPQGAPRTESHRLAGHEEAELADLLDVIAHSRYSERVAWALGRFEMGCSRRVAREGLTDHLLVLRALLGGTHGDDGRIPMRLAALCAEEGDRSAVASLALAALDLEAVVIASGRSPELSEPVRHAVIGLETHLRALLRDLICGYLEDDLVIVADEILLAGSFEGEILAHDTRRSPSELPSEEADRRAEIAALETQEFRALDPELER
nr:hypothetical protein [Thermoleophilaceae bacterium]